MHNYIYYINRKLNLPFLSKKNATTWRQRVKYEEVNLTLAKQTLEYRRLVLEGVRRGEY
jgi:hypothetical protein